MRASCVLSLLLGVLLTTVSCKESNSSIAIDACALVTKAEVEKAAGASVTNTVAEAPHVMSMSAGTAMETTSSCSYMLEAAAGKPARIKINVDAFHDHFMALTDFTQWRGAKRAVGLGDD